MALSKDEIMESIKEMSVLELSELVKDLEEVFGVSGCAGRDGHRPGRGRHRRGGG